MEDRQHEQSGVTPETAETYEAPVVEDIESVDGPAVTAAGSTGPR
jgi:hypothetical protein